ncbi:MAG: hypothetical protein ACR5LF_02050 [Symbiopectobacterium sp.]
MLKENKISHLSGGILMTNAGSERQIHFLGKKLGLDLFLDEKQQILLLIDGKCPVSLQLDNGK